MRGFSPAGSTPIAVGPSFTAVAAVTENLLLLSPAVSDAATIDASSEVSTLPATNLQNMQPRRVWRSDGQTESLVITLETATAANMLAVNRPNFGGSAVWRVRGATSLANLTASPTVDTGSVSVWPSSGKPTVDSWPAFVCALRWTNESELAYWRVDIADPEPDYIEIGRLALGRAWQPTDDDFDFDGATPLAFDQRDVQTRTDYGATFTDRRNASAARRFAVKFSALDKREALDGLAEIQRLRGMWGDVFAFLEPGATDDFYRFSVQGVFTVPQAHDIVPQFSANGERWTATLSVTEVL